LTVGLAPTPREGVQSKEDPDIVITTKELEYDSEFRGVVAVTTGAALTLRATTAEDPRKPYREIATVTLQSVPVWPEFRNRVHRIFGRVESAFVQLTTTEGHALITKVVAPAGSDALGGYCAVNVTAVSVEDKGIVGIKPGDWTRGGPFGSKLATATEAESASWKRDKRKLILTGSAVVDANAISHCKDDPSEE
jgi:hypothetical protein